ncbi:hypothetical protein [Streptosporangium sp. NPDC003464]
MRRFIADLQHRHTAALDRLETVMRKGTAGGVKITRKKGEPWISVPPLDKQEEPAGLTALFWSHLNLYGRFELDMSRHLELDGVPLSRPN